MISFYLKKNFCDGWDNFLFVVITNAITLALAVGIWFAISFTITTPVVSLAIFVLGICLLTVYSCSLSNCCARIADFKSVSIKSVFANCKNVLKTALALGIFISILVFIVVFAIPFYFNMNAFSGNFLWLILGSLLMWFVLITAFALLWFFPLYSQIGGGFLKNLKKSYIVMFDNIFFTMFLAIYVIFLLVFSLLLASFAPGVSGVLLATNNALRLRLYKYDWMEANPYEVKMKRRIPWDELTAEDNEKVGDRSFKSFLFPWK